MIPTYIFYLLVGSVIAGLCDIDEPLEYAVFVLLWPFVLVSMLIRVLTNLVVQRIKLPGRD